MDDDFAIFTEQDKRHYAYGLCVLGFTAAGATLGSMAALQTLPGAFGGTVMGLFLCRTIDQPLKRVLFDASVRMRPEEFRQLAEQTARSHPRLSRSEVLDLLGKSRQMAAKTPAQYRC